MWERVEKEERRMSQDICLENEYKRKSILREGVNSPGDMFMGQLKEVNLPEVTCEFLHPYKGDNQTLYVS